MKRRWKFYAQTEHADENCYLDEENVFIGTGHEAQTEAERRSTAWEDKTGFLIEKITMESQGKAE